MSCIFHRSKTLPFLLKVLFPICLGMAVIAFMYCREFKLHQLLSWSFTMSGLLSVALGFMLIGIKDCSLSLRYRLLCSPDNLSWKSAFKTNYLCEFTSAITPSSIGGSALIMIYLYREGISAGRSTAVMVSTLFLDEMFFVLACPFCFLLFPSEKLFGLSVQLSSCLQYTFTFVYILIVAYSLLLYTALFRKPEFIRKVITALQKIPFLKRYKESFSKFTADLETSSKEMKIQSLQFWMKASCATIIAWTTRFAVACALFLPYADVWKQTIILGRQLIMWIVMMITPTAGGSGISEYLFTQYFSDLSVPQKEIIFITCFWRIITYYSYLLVGICIMPSWIRNGNEKKLH